MAEARKNRSADFKKKVVLEALKQQKTTYQIVSEYGIHAHRSHLETLWVAQKPVLLHPEPMDLYEQTVWLRHEFS